jgi:RNase P protein component
MASSPIDQFVAKALMVAFAMIVDDKLGERTPEMLLTQRYQSIHAFFLDRTHKPLRVGIGVSRQLHRRRAVRRNPFELRIPSIRCVGASSN